MSEIKQCTYKPKPGARTYKKYDDNVIKQALEELSSDGPSPSISAEAKMINPTGKMNVVQHEKSHTKLQVKFKNELVRKDASRGIRGTLPVLHHRSYNNASRIPNTAPRYQFNEPARSNFTSMGPPSGLPIPSKRRLVASNSTKPDSSSSGKPWPRVIASDSAVETTQDLCTPRNRPNALRYISSSSRGGHSGNRSARSTSTSAVEASVILSISEGRGMARGEIGMAAVDLRHPHLVLCQFSDSLLYTHTLTKINYFNPVEIIVPHTFCEGVKPNQLYQLIRDTYPLVNLTTVQRRHFNDAAGRQHIQTLCAPQYRSVYLQVHQKFYALTAAAAVLKYVEYIQCIVFVRDSLKIEYHSSENTMIIDVATATQLELVQPLVPSAGATCCLLGVLGPTYTIGGIRALRANILQPSCKQEFIENRLDAVQDLIENEDGLMSSLQDVVKKLSDVDKILLLCMESPNQTMDRLGEAQLNQMILLKTTMDIVPQLVEALALANSGRLLKIKLDLENPNYKEIADRIRSIIQEDAHVEKGAMGSLQRCFAVKPEINGLLDVARRTYSELIEDIQKMVEQLAETYDMPLRLNQNVMKGFHIVLPLAPKNRRNFCVEDLPEIFIQVHNSGASVSMTTEELVVMDQQAKESLKEIQRMSNVVISSLLKELRPFMSTLYTLCENVSELDILLALAQASSIGSYIRPDFGNYFDVRNSVHPLLDYNSQEMPVPNDIYASPEQNFTIITGPNMGGKSIYIKQIAVLQVMGQLGCFLPATTAVLRLCDRLFSRIGFNDSVELNASTYVFEMKEMQHILRSLTSSSLVIIDELCRGTCTEEGTSMAWAICEELLLSDAFTFFTTHFIYLTRLQDLYFNVVNRHTAVAEEYVANSESEDAPKRLVYQHKVEPGITKIERYGLALASKTNLPENTVKLAVELAELIRESRQPQEIGTPQKGDEELLYKLNADLRYKHRRNELSDEQHKLILHRFKYEHPSLLERLKAERCQSNIRKDSSAHNTTVVNSRQIEISSDTNDSNNGKITISQRPTNHIEQAVNSTDIYSTSDNQEDTNVKIESASNYIPVKSSDGLLNSVMQMDSADDHKSSQDELPNVIIPNNNERPAGTIESQTDRNAVSGYCDNNSLPNVMISKNKETISTNGEFQKNTNISSEFNDRVLHNALITNNQTINSTTQFYNGRNIFEKENSDSPNITHKYQEIIDKRKSDSQNTTRRKIFEYDDNNLPNVIISKSQDGITNRTSYSQSTNESGKNKITVSYHETYISQAINDTYIDSDDDSDIAEAATQVLQEHSLMDDDDSGNSDMSIDEDLLRETAEELNEEMNSNVTDGILLTPPTEFRDFM